MSRDFNDRCWRPTICESETAGKNRFNFANSKRLLGLVKDTQNLQKMRTMMILEGEKSEIIIRKKGQRMSPNIMAQR